MTARNSFGTPVIGSHGPEQVAHAGGGPVLLFNNSASVDVMLFDDLFGDPGDPSNSTPLPALGTVVLDGKRNIYAQTLSGTAELSKFPGGLSFFQLVELLVKTLLVSGSAGNGVYVYSGAAALGNLIASIIPATGPDPFGNQAFAGVSVYDPVSLGGTGNVVEIDVGKIFLFNAAALFFTLDAHAQLMYQAPGGAGNLTASTAPAAGTDQFGNDYQQGIVSYQPGLPSTYAQLLGGALRFVQAGSPAFPPDAGSNGTDVILNSGSSGADGCQIAVGETTGVLIQTQAGAPANPLLTVLGNLLVQDKILARVAGAAEAPHPWSFSAAGYAQTAGRMACQYLLIPSPSDGTKGAVHVAGSVVVPAGGFVGGQAITNAAAAAYRPAHGVPLTGFDITSGALCRLTWTTGGVIQTNNVIAGAVAAGDTIDVAPATFMLAN